ncbi:MAG TPA: metallophosphoesterase [Gemmataceae bacterium]|nr:metallophosphoesterase [Gemmataceae bacterium]
MKRLLLCLCAAGLLASAVAFSGPKSSSPGLDFKVEDRNPVTHLRLNNDPAEFQFAIVSDRTGGHRPNVFAQAVEKLNLLQPEFVLSVGDLIEGGKKKPEQLAAEWKEFDGLAKRLRMPFFYVPGNHDVGNADTAKLWDEKLGRRHYYFVYRNVLFLVLNTDDPPGSGQGHLGKEQIAWAEKVLADNRDVRWTIVALHKPVWNVSNVEKTGWLDVEKALADRPYTVFCGHVHRYHKFVRQGRNYYQLATTGGGSKMRGVHYGEFDHLVWVTMKKDGPVLANLLLDGILAEDLKQPVVKEPGVSTAGRKPTHPARGKVLFEGMPTPGAYVVLSPVEGKGVRADSLVEADGSFTLSTYTANDGAAEGEYTVTIVWRKPMLDAEGKPGPNLLPARYADAKTSGLKATIKAGKNELSFELRK